MQRKIQRLALIYCAVVFMFNAAASVAAASTESADPSTAEIQEYSKRFGVDIDQAEANLLAQHRGVLIVNELERVLGPDYAGVWFDNESGEFVIPMLDSVSTQSMRSDVEEQLAKDELSDDYRLSSANFSWSALESAQDELDAQLSDAIKAGLVRTSLDPGSNAVAVEMASKTPESDEKNIAQVVSESPIAIELRRSDESEFKGRFLSCNPYYWSKYCSIPLRGGTGLNIHNEPIFSCTVGFRARGFNGQWYVLTAGHCFGVNPTAPPVKNWDSKDEFVQLHYIGELEQRSFVPHDWGKINATNSYWDVTSWPSKIVKWTAYNESPAGIINEWYPIDAEGTAYVGQVVYHSGETTGTSWGIVKVVNETYTFDTAYGGVTITNLTRAKGGCVFEGDSGGPVFAANAALGMLTGSTFDEKENYCAEPVWWFTNIKEATSDLGVTVVGGPPEVNTTFATPESPYQATLHGDVNPNAWTTYDHFEYGKSSYSNSTSDIYDSSGTAWIGRSRTVTGLDPASTYQFRIVASNTLGTTYGAKGTFTTPPAPPKVTTEAATNVKKDSATLHGAVNPGGAATSFRFEWGTTTGYGGVAPVPEGEAGSGLSDVSVQTEIKGLAIDTTYHYRIVATNSQGTTYGLDREFRTPAKPSITTEEPIYTNTFEPQVNATIDPERATTTYQFEYGTTISYGTKIPLSQASIGAGDVGVGVEQTLKGLARNTPYHYRVSAENEVGLVQSADQSFTTLPPCKGVGEKCEWSLRSTPNPPPPNPEAEFKDVSCASASMCVAVGRNLSLEKSFVERWNGSLWTVLANPAGQISKVSCASATACVAVGVSSTGVAQTWMIFEYLGGWVVSPQAPPLPGGATETTLKGVSCTATACTAVGSYKSGSTYKPLIERWNGSSWSLQTPPVRPKAALRTECWLCRASPLRSTLVSR